MVAKHDLHKDFPEYAEQLDSRPQSDPAFAKLLEDYQQLDRQILDLEAVEESSGDEELGRLRRERVLLKDKIAQQLKYPS